MISLNSCWLCDWWWLGWLLLPLLGWLLYHWWQGSGYRSRIESLEKDLSAHQLRVGQAEADLEACKKARSKLSLDNMALESQLKKLGSGPSDAAAKDPASSSLKGGDGSKANLGLSGKASSTSGSEAGISKGNGDDKGKEDKQSELRDSDASKTSSDLSGEGSGVSGFGGKSLSDTGSGKDQKLSGLKGGASGGGSGESSGIDPLGFAPGPKDTSSTGGISGGAFSKLSNDNLQLIEGIGPKMESILKENGITNWSVLASKSESDLKGILNKFGDRYRIIDPKEWSAQAALARDGDFEGLMAFQKSDGSDSKAEKKFIKMGLLKRWDKDDLKAIEGIGPKIASLLENDGINTWQKLSETSVQTIEQILERAGKRYQLADPGTWPKQAGMAARGEFDALQKYQDELKWGKE